MKKWIGAALVVVIVIGGYIYFFKRSDVMDKVIEDNLAQALNVEKVIFDESGVKLSYTIKSYNDQQIFSEITVVDGDEANTIPVISDIERGEFEDDGQTFDYAHVVTHLDFSALDPTPPFDEKDFIGIEHFIDSKGLVRGKFKIDEVKYSNDEKNESLDFGGINAVFDSNFIKRKDFDLDLAFAGAEYQIQGQNFSLSEVKTAAKKVGELCEINAQPFTFEASNIIKTNYGAVDGNGFCKWNEEFNAYEFDIKSKVDGLKVDVTYLGYQFEVLSMTASSYMRDIGKGNAKWRMTTEIIPSEDILKQFGINLQPTAVNIDLGLNDYPFLATRALSRINEYTSEQDITARLVDFLNGDTSLDAKFALLSKDGAVKVDSDFHKNDQAKPLTSEEMDAMTNLIELLPRVDGNIRVVADNSFLMKSGMQGLINMFFGNLIENNTVTNQSIVNVKVNQGTVVVKDQVLYQP